MEKVTRSFLFTTVTALAISFTPQTAKADYPNRMVSIGDSISTGFDLEWLCGPGFPDCPEFNWSTGPYNYKSHYNQIRSFNPYIQYANVAHDGKRYDDFPEQATSAVAYQADYTTVMLGGNDICRDTVANIPSNTMIEQYFRAGMNTLMQGGVKNVLIVGIPDGEALFSVAFNKLTREGLTCNQLWYNLSLAKKHYCPTWLGAEITTNIFDSCFYYPFTCSRARQRRAAATARRNSINDLLQTLAGEYAANNPDKKIKYIPFTTGFTANDVNNVDCFHPSKAGQIKLGDDTFKRGIAFP